MLSVEQLTSIAANLNDGVPPLPTKSRKWPLPLLRYMIIEELSRHGLSLAKSGSLVGLNHSTAVHGRKLLIEITACPGDTYEKQLYQRFRAEVERQSV